MLAPIPGVHLTLSVSDLSAIKSFFSGGCRSLVVYGASKWPRPLSITARTCMYLRLRVRGP
jgi:hypothetical protein